MENDAVSIQDVVARRAPDGFARYLRMVRWAGKRYADAKGRVVVSIGGMPSLYSRIELAAARKFLHMIGTAS
jgi:hypothetical protein